MICTCGFASGQVVAEELVPESKVGRRLRYGMKYLVEIEDCISLSR